MAFHREKYVAAGGPDGGDGGRGGNVVFQADTNLSTLVDFKYKRRFFAENGSPGGGGRRSGRNAPDLVIRVPRGDRRAGRGLGTGHGRPVGGGARGGRARR